MRNGGGLSAALPVVTDSLAGDGRDLSQPHSRVYGGAALCVSGRAFGPQHGARGDYGDYRCGSRPPAPEVLVTDSDVGKISSSRARKQNSFVMAPLRSLNRLFRFIQVLL